MRTEDFARSATYLVTPAVDQEGTSVRPVQMDGGSRLASAIHSAHKVSLYIHSILLAESILLGLV